MRIPPSLNGVIPHGITLQSAQAPGAMAMVHEALMRGLRAVSEYLDDHHIEFWLDSGTLLGARRHGGLIPWDDDVDLAMTRDSFQTLLSTVAQGLPPDLSWTTPVNDPTQPGFLPGKFRIDGTYAVEQAWFHHRGPPPDSLGLSIDVFTVERIPRGALARRLARRYRYEYYLRETATHHRIAARHRKDRVHAGALRAVPDAVFAASHARLRSASSDSATWGYSLNQPWDQLELRDQDLWPLEMLPFGDLLLPSPSNSDRYLSQLYGSDFLTPPAPAARRPHNAFFGFS